MSPLALAILIIAVALTFDYINGFHDAANSVATPEATRHHLTPPGVNWGRLLFFAVALALVHNMGFKEATNTEPRVVATRVLTPLQAVMWAAFFNFVSAFT